MVEWTLGWIGLVVGGFMKLNYYAKDTKFIFGSVVNAIAFYSC